LPSVIDCLLNFPLADQLLQQKDEDKAYDKG
jgi:hypothetical protein